MIQYSILRYLCSIQAFCFVGECVAPQRPNVSPTFDEMGGVLAHGAINAYPWVIKHGYLGKSHVYGGYSWENHPFFGWIFQHAMFHYWRASYVILFLAIPAIGDPPVDRTPLTLW